jgi:hypothetical protein
MPLDGQTRIDCGMSGAEGNSLKHEVTFKFSGLIADDDEEIGGSEHSAYTEAAKRLLALHAHTYVVGKTPTAARDRSSEYDVRHRTTQSGCVEDVWSVYINNPWAIAAASVIGSAFHQEIRSVAYSFKDFLSDSVSSIASGRTTSLPHLRRIEPTLEMVSATNHPFIDVTAEEDDERTKLRVVGARVLVDVGKPIGRSSSLLRIYCDGDELVKIDRHMLRQLLEREITSYTQSIRTKSQQLFLT